MVDPGEVGNEPHFRWLLHCSRAGQGSAVQDGCNAALQQLPSCSAGCSAALPAYCPPLRLVFPKKYFRPRVKLAQPKVASKPCARIFREAVDSRLPVPRPVWDTLWATICGPVRSGPCLS